MFMKVIFLDFDGVLNNNSYFLDSKEKAPFFLQDEKMILLKQIVDSTNAKIVLSISWREIWNSDLDISLKLKDYFYSFDLSVYDVTKNINYNRPLEISTWLKENNVSSYVILDDIANPWYEHVNNVVVTNKEFNGLSQDDVNKAIDILKK